MRNEADTSRKNTQVILLLPTGRDAEIVQNILAQERISSMPCVSYEEMLQQISTECGPLIIAQEAFYKVNVNSLLAILESQPQWSELPVIVLEGRGREKQLMNALSSNPSLSFIPRPLKRSAFVMLVRLAMENRLRQFAVRDLLFAQKALQTSGQRYRELFDSITDLIYTQDLEGRFLSLNPAFETLFGYDKADIIGRKASEFMDPKWAHLFEQKYLAAIKDKGFCEGISSYHTKDGKKVYIEYRSRRIEPETGDAFISGVGRNVTERIETRKEKKRLEAQLLQTRKMEAIATLTGGIAHDYNNLLSIVMGNLSLAMDETERGSYQADCLKEVEMASMRIRDLTHELMALSRGGAPVRRVGSLAELLQNVKELIPADSGVSLKMAVPKDLWPSSYDPNKMNAVFRNLLTNAVEAMPDGGTITIKAENLHIESNEQYSVPPLKQGDYVHISMQDQGKGIPRENLDKIFNPYFSTKDMGVQKGMGLGLATSYAIVQKHGGHIAIESSLDVGTTVNVHLPAESQAVLEGAKIASAVDAESPVKRVLVMDDEEMLSRMVGQMLKHLGYTVETVQDGHEAIKAYQEGKDSGEPFDVVILDLTVKDGMGGEQTIQELLKIDPNVKAVVSSGYFNDPVMADFEKYGFKGALAKPYQKANLKESLDDLFK